jgi:c-di-GMP-binding flagellar brake protein YcgR
MRDRRRYPRFSASHYVRFKYNGRTRTSNTLDLSLGGAKIETVFPMKVGDVIQVSIVIGGNTISPRGKVVHGKEFPELRYNAGFNFETMEPGDQDYLVEYLTKLSR